jgi:hypothetical protein
VSTTVPHPPHVSEEDKPLRRVVALAYRAGWAAGKAEHDAFEDAMVAYNKERPGGERIAASGARCRDDRFRGQGRSYVVLEKRADRLKRNRHDGADLVR